MRQALFGIRYACGSRRKAIYWRPESYDETREDLRLPIDFLRPGMKDFPIRRVCLGTGLLSVLVLLLIVVFSPHKTVYDEPYHLADIPLVHQTGWVAPF